MRRPVTMPDPRQFGVRKSKRVDSFTRLIVRQRDLGERTGARRSASTQLGVKGSQIQILSSRPAFSQVGGRFLRDGKAAFFVLWMLVVAVWSRPGWLVLADAAGVAGVGFGECCVDGFYGVAGGLPGEVGVDVGGGGDGGVPQGLGDGEERDACGDGDGRGDVARSCRVMMGTLAWAASRLKWSRSVCGRSGWPSGHLNTRPENGSSGCGAAGVSGAWCVSAVATRGEVATQFLLLRVLGVVMTRRLLLMAERV